MLIFNCLKAKSILCISAFLGTCQEQMCSEYNKLAHIFCDAVIQHFSPLSQIIYILTSTTQRRQTKYMDGDLVIIFIRLINLFIPACFPGCPETNIPSAWSKNKYITTKA